MYRWWPDLLGSWVFYSILPLPHGCRPRFERIARFAPVVGLGLGGAQAVVWQLGAWAGCPPGALGALVVALGLWLTGGLHFDGVLDSGDGLAAGSRQLEAMADSRIGASGLVAGVLVLLLQGGALVSLGPGAPAALVWSAVWARVAPLVAIGCFPYLRPGGGAGFHRQGRSALATELLPSALVVGLLGGVSGSLGGTAALLAGLIGAIPALLVPLELGRRLGGHTGDSYGACVEWTAAFSLWASWGVLRLGS